MAKSNEKKLYYFIDIDTQSRQILSWDVESKETVQVTPSNGCHRVFLSKGQYNKLISRLESGD
ncbi:MAG: hypothetical protein AAFX06_21415 [Planctomycetota bacterium]